MNLTLFKHILALGCLLAVSCAPVASGRVATSENSLKNLIVIVGDGMGPQQMGLLFDYVRNVQDMRVGERSAIERMMDQGSMGLVSTAMHETLVADSAGGLTQFAIGRPSRAEMIGIDKDGEPKETILELAKKLGKSTGLITDTRITHATPAVFAAHVAHRSDENKIAQMLLDNNVDILMGGGLRHFIARNDGRFPAKSKRNDDLDLISYAVANGYSLALNRQELSSLKSNKILGLFASSALPDAIAQTSMEKESNYKVPNLVDMTARALAALSSNEKGFFLMVEAGQIDWAAHRNDVGTLLQEMLRLDSVVDYINKWNEGRSDTLVLLTADHETGSFGFSYSSHQIPAPQPLKGSAFHKQFFSPEQNYVNPSVFQLISKQNKSYKTLFENFVLLPQQERNAARFSSEVEKATGLKLSLSESEDILRRWRRVKQLSGRKKGDILDIQDICDLSEFYPASDVGASGLLARKLGRQLGTVWSTGTHTSTPVLVIAAGPVEFSKNFGGLWSSAELGLATRKILGWQ